MACSAYTVAMKRSDFAYHLPPELIAQHPLPERDASRLLCLDASHRTIEHRHFRDIPDLLRPGDLLVFNNTRVIPARLYGHKESGGRVEILIERITGSNTALAHVRSSRSPRAGTLIRLSAGPGQGAVEATVQVTGREGALYKLVAAESGRSIAQLLQAFGHVPLPPYIERGDEASDRERYQTVYAEREGAVAAPTAGLHFTEALLADLESRGIRRASVTLHVGSGTFQPVRAENIEDHHMHSEFAVVNEAVCEAVRETRRRGGRVVAVGTTAVRSLESASREDGAIEPFEGDTSIFIYPGYRFRNVDALITNFHLPESTLMMLVSALAGRDIIMRAYREAVDRRYRFFSYGDAMFINASGGTV